MFGETTGSVDLNVVGVGPVVILFCGGDFEQPEAKTRKKPQNNMFRAFLNRILTFIGRLNIFPHS